MLETKESKHFDFTIKTTDGSSYAFSAHGVDKADAASKVIKNLEEAKEQLLPLTQKTR